LNLCAQFQNTPKTQEDFKKLEQKINPIIFGIPNAIKSLAFKGENLHGKTEDLSKNIGALLYDAKLVIDSIHNTK
jgi:hypothetical protein